MTNVVGTDDISPSYNPSDKFILWSINDVFKYNINGNIVGSIGLNKYVPKINDLVVDQSVMSFYLVTALDSITYIASLTEKDVTSLFNTTVSSYDTVFGLETEYQSYTYKTFLDTSVTPYKLTIDTRWKIPGTMSNYCKIFLGADITSTGTVISMVYDNSGNLRTNNIPLELVVIENMTNYSLKIVMPCNTNITMPDNEIVTAVIYDDNGIVIQKRQLLIENTSFIRSINAGTKYVVSIGLTTPFISISNPTVINLPLNIPVSQLNLTGVVNYSDGSSANYPVDNNKFTLQGISQYDPNLDLFVGQTFGLVLRYNLSEGEYSYQSTPNNKYVSVPYTLQLTNQNNSYIVKIYGYPVWVNSSIGYTMKYFLFNLDRNLYFDVTNLVTYTNNTSFNGKLYNSLQVLNLSLNLQSVSMNFIPFIYTQIYSVLLDGIPTPNQTPWTLQHIQNNTLNTYGSGLRAVIDLQDSSKLRLDSGITTQTGWLAQVYNNIYPILNPNAETTPIQPTWFELTYNNITVQVPIGNWNQNISIGVSLTLDVTVFLRFYTMSSNNTEINLGMSAMLLLEAG